MSLFSKQDKTKRIFLDYASTTPLLHEVKEVMDVYFSKNFYNPSAIYIEGKVVREELNLLRQKTARLLHASSKDIIFTSGGTESNNQALLGIFEAVRIKIDKPHFIISAIEHSAITEAAKEIVERGGEVSIIPVDEKGRVSPENIKNLIKNKTVLISVMLANNEIGTIEPVSKISRVIKEYRKKTDSQFPYFHTDASQAANYISLDITSLGVDLLTLDGSKIYGPKGIGILLARQDILIKPIIFGGGQEKGLRSGTENMALISGFTKALEIADRDKEKEAERLNKIKDFFITNIEKDFPKLIINTPTEDSLPNIVSISIPDQIGEFIAIKLDQEGIMVSTGSSCGVFKDIGSSTTIKGIGKEDLAESTIRFSFGRDTDEESIKKTLQALKKILFP
jgi:cysteine desulfurase